MGRMNPSSLCRQRSISLPSMSGDMLLMCARYLGFRLRSCVARDDSALHRFALQRCGVCATPGITGYNLFLSQALLVASRTHILPADVYVLHSKSPTYCVA